MNEVAAHFALAVYFDGTGKRLSHLWVNVGQHGQPSDALSRAVLAKPEVAEKIEILPTLVGLLPGSPHLA